MLKEVVLVASMIGCGCAAWADSHASEASGAAEEADAAAAQEDVDLAAAEEIYQNSCRACHGNNAGGAASYPGLADLEPDYVVERLERYRSGEKIGPNSILMIQHAKKLSDEDIANLSVYVTTAFD